MHKDSVKESEEEEDIREKTLEQAEKHEPVEITGTIQKDGKAEEASQEGEEYKEGKDLENEEEGEGNYWIKDEEEEKESRRDKLEEENDENHWAENGAEENTGKNTLEPVETIKLGGTHEPAKTTRPVQEDCNQREEVEPVHKEAWTWW